MTVPQPTPAALAALDETLTEAIRLLRGAAYREGYTDGRGVDLSKSEIDARIAADKAVESARLALLAAARPQNDADGVRLIAAERARQLAAEGWTPEHDDTHRLGEMAITAACYAANGTDAEVLVGDNDAWPWGSCDDKRRKHPRIRQLAIAGALIAAEIDRLTRAAQTHTETDRAHQSR